MWYQSTSSQILVNPGQTQQVGLLVHGQQSYMLTVKGMLMPHTIGSMEYAH